jgi:methionine-rich copper-binding protein CopC
MRSRMKKKLLVANAVAVGLFGLCIGAESQELAWPRSSMKAPSNCIINEDKDQEIKITLKGEAKEDFSVKIFDPQNQLIKTETVKAGNYAETPAEITIPADKKTGQYLLTFDIVDGKGNFAAPLSTLPEVYLCNNMFVVGKASKYYFNTLEKKATPITITPHKRSATITNKADKEIAKTETGEKLEFEIPAAGLFIDCRAAYIAISSPLVLSASEEKFFQVEPEKIEMLLGKK